MIEQQISAYLTRKQSIESSTEFPDNFRHLLLNARQKYADQVALNFFEQGDGVQITYAVLYDRVHQVADGLHKLGVGKGTHVAVMLTNRIEFPITWLALAVLGAVMVPVNVTYTSNELDYVINDADCEFVIAEDCFLQPLADMQRMPAAISPERQVIIGGAIPDGFTSWVQMADQSSADFLPDWPIKDDELLNIQYTSGTTGFPKGCMQSQKYWILTGCVVAASMDHDIRNILTDHSFFYMDPQWQLVLAMHVGARLNVASRLSSSRFFTRVRQWEVDMAWIPRPLLGEAPQPDDKDLPLKILFIGGASADSIEAAQKRFGVQVCNAYGMTEIGPGLLVPNEITAKEVLGTCGMVAPYREGKIVREDGSKAEFGEAGELWIRGAGIFDGYYNKPEANAESFVDGWFRTGDKFTQTEHGFYKIVGRLKDMIRRSAENISALEVEYTLNQHPQIMQSAVVPVPDEYRGEEVKAYVRLRDGSTQEQLSPQQIVEHCQSQLAAFKVPRYIEYVSEFPLTPSSKIAKSRLTEGVQDLTENSWDRQAVAL